MAGRGPSAEEQSQYIVNEILKFLRPRLPGLLQTDRAFAFQFCIEVRKGMCYVMNILTWDDMFEPVYQKSGDAADDQISRMEKWLLKSLPTRLSESFHGEILVNVTVKDRKVGFGFKSHHQVSFEWTRVARESWDDDMRRKRFEEDRKAKSRFHTGQ